MGVSTAAEITAEGLVEALADAGEFDAGVEALDALRGRDSALPGLVRLQALLFDMQPVGAPHRAEVLQRLRGMSIEALARDGGVVACAIAARVVSTAFPEDAGWAKSAERFGLLAAPLPDSTGDPRHGQVNQRVAQGALNEAYGMLRTLSREHPGDKDLHARIDVLRGLLFDPAHTRPYRAIHTSDLDRVSTSPSDPGPEVSADTHGTSAVPPRAVIDPGRVLATVAESVRVGDLSRALGEVTPLALGTHHPMAMRLRDALQRLLQADDSPSVGITRTEGLVPAERAVREGRLREARDGIRAVLAARPSTDLTARLSQRLADLDLVIDGAQPPVPRASWTPEEPASTDGLSDLSRTDPDVAALSPDDPVGGDGSVSVSVQRRKIVRLD